MNLETKTHMKKHLPEADNNPDRSGRYHRMFSCLIDHVVVHSNIDYKTLSELLPTSLNDDMLKYLKTVCCCTTHHLFVLRYLHF